MVESGTSQRDVVAISVEGTFDPMMASALRATLGRSPTPAPVVLDFSRAREVSDLAIAMLVHGLAADRIPVRLRGLSLHHARMLRYLGLDAAPPTAPA